MGGWITTQEIDHNQIDFKECLETSQGILKILLAFKLIPHTALCPKCDTDMQLKTHSAHSHIDPIQYNCKDKKCRKRETIRKHLAHGPFLKLQLLCSIIIL